MKNTREKEKKGGLQKGEGNSPKYPSGGTFGRTSDYDPLEEKKKASDKRVEGKKWKQGGEGEKVLGCENGTSPRGEKHNPNHPERDTPPKKKKKKKKKKTTTPKKKKKKNKTKQKTKKKKNPPHKQKTPPKKKKPTKPTTPQTQTKKKKKTTQKKNPRRWTDQ